MNCILYLTDFSEPSDKALAYIMPVADELRARIIFVHHINGDAAKQKVNKKEEKEFLPYFNLLKSKVIKYAFANNCEMRTGHLLIKGDIVENMLSLLKQLSPYAIATHYDYAARSKILLGNVYHQLLKVLTAPVMIIPEYAEYVEIKAIGYFTGMVKTMHAEFNDLVYKMRMFKSKLFAFYLTPEIKQQPDRLIDELTDLFPDAVKNDRISLKKLEPKYIASRIDKLVEEMEINLAAFNAGDQIFDDIFNSGHSVRPFLLKTPVLIYPERFVEVEN